MFTHKMYGVDKNNVKKLQEFQLSLMRRKFGKEFDKMAFVVYVQFKNEIMKDPVMTQIMVADSSIHIDYTVIPKCAIFKIERNNKEVIIRFKRPITAFGSYMRLDFEVTDKIEDFVNAIGEIQILESDGSVEGDSPPTTDGSD